MAHQVALFLNSGQPDPMQLTMALESISYVSNFLDTRYDRMRQIGTALLAVRVFGRFTTYL
jgi:hypothetical protein